MSKLKGDRFMAEVLGVWWTGLLVSIMFFWGIFPRNVFGADPIIEKLQEKGIITAEEAEMLYQEKAKAQPVTLSTANSKLTLKGRFFVGYYQSEDMALPDEYNNKSNSFNYKSGSFEVPEAKLQLTWNPADAISVVTRMSLNNATFNTLDYFYAQINGIIPADPKSRLRAGKIKVDFGEETHTDNPVENSVGLISNSVAKVGGYDEGVELYGNFIPKIFGYVVSVTNGSAGTGLDNNTNKALSVKLFAQPLEALYFSGSYYYADLPKDGKTDFTLGGIGTGPKNTPWTREVWECDVKGKIVQKDGKGGDFERARIAGAYGVFNDNFKGAVPDRQGDYYFLEAAYNFTSKIYLGIRYSVMEFDKKYTEWINGVDNANEYRRTSLGLGYRLNKLLTLKGEYSWNKIKRVDAATGNKSLTDNLFALGLAASF